MPGAGTLRDRFSFQSRDPDANGDPLGPFAPRFTVSARTIYLRGSEPVMQQRLQGQQPIVLTIREEPRTRQITNAWRAVDVLTGYAYNVTSVSPGDRGFLDILATRLVDGDAG